ncbi:anti-sigma factor domain-containing protein [Blastococcus sp. TF02A-26]|uniref:anti-sigma factor domain-containing protein n=1 Tax=Blastococcus sp. TF02A-26 TaxID=2250577 RepID=UPI000DE97D53|nr:anti-sigma factor [Blastococcus sp. TF02A-26]RBY88341.1 anti-sigma factor [Blastococcus sp. TF02A-26]
MIDQGAGAGPDRHEPFDELAVGWALHALEPEDDAVFSAHLPGCARCARTVAETAEVMGAMATDLPQAEPSTGLRERLRAAVESTEQVSRPEPPQPVAPPQVVPLAPRRAAPAPSAAEDRPPAVVGVGDGTRPAWRRVLPNALVAAAAAAVLGLGAWNVVLDDARDDAVASAAEQTRIVESLLEPGTATVAPLTEDGERVATVVARDAQVQVVTQGLGPNDRESETYVVWGMTDDEAPVALGTFDVVRSQIDVRTVGSTSTGLDDYSGYAISIEPGREAPAEPSEVVATG